MRSFKHWTTRYLKNRVSVMLYEWKFPDNPWLTRDMIKILECWLQDKDKGFEWGSGRSTLWFSKKVAHIQSVEHDRAWFDQIQTKIKENNISNVSYHFCENEDQYVNKIKDLPQKSLDFVLVDGVFRAQCALASLNHLKSGGCLILDNCNWYLPSDSLSPSSKRIKAETASDEWLEFQGRVKGWRSIWTSNGVWDTALWVKG